MRRPKYSWQWLWKSRGRLFSVGLMIAVFGVFTLIYSISQMPHNHRAGRGLPGGVIFSLWGGYWMLQALLSGSGVFGEGYEQDDSK